MKAIKEPAASLAARPNLSLVAEAARALFHSFDSSIVIDTLLELSRQFIRADGYAVWRKSADDIWKIARSTGLSAGFIAAGTMKESSSGISLEPMIFEDLETDPLLTERLPVLRAEGVQSMLVIPLQVGGERNGTVVFYRRTVDAFEADEVQAASLLGHLGAAAIGTAEIVERRNTELELVTDNVPSLISYVDSHLRFRRVNEAYERFFGIKRQDIIGKTVEEVVGPEHYVKAKHELERGLRGEPRTYQSRVRHQDGSIREIELTYTPDFRPDGTVRGLVVQVQDVTSRNRAEEARARLAAIVATSDDAIVGKTLEGRIVTWNQGAERIYGYSAEEAVGQHITMIIPPERRREEDDVLARIRSGQKVDHFETERVRKDGRVVIVSLSISPILSEQGTIIGASKVARDITERRRIERELLVRQRYLQTVLDSMPDCVKVLARDGTVLEMNRAGLRMLEAEQPSQVLGLCVYSLISPRDVDAFRAMNEGIFEGAPGGSLQFGVVTLKGVRLVFETEIAPLLDANNKVTAALSVTRDVTLRRATEARKAFVAGLDSTIRPLSDAAEITQAAARALGEYLRADRCAYADVDDDEDTFNLSGDYSKNVPSIVGRYRFTQFGAECLRCMRAGEPYIIYDAETDPRVADVREAYRQTMIRSVICIPLHKNGRFVAAMAVHQATPRQWRPDEVDLVQQVAARSWESIERARVQRELRARDEEFRTLADTMPTLAWMAHPNGDVFWYNRRWYEYTGATLEKMEGWGWQSVHDAEVLPSVIERWKISLDTGEPFEMVFPLRGADGQLRSFLTRGEAVKTDGRVVRWFGTTTDITAQQEAEHQLRNAVTRETKARQTAELLNRVGPLLAGQLDSQTLTQSITDIATQAVGAEFGAFFHNAVNESGQSYILYTLSGAPREAFARFPMPRNTAVFGPTFAGKGIVRSDDIKKDPRYGKNAPYSGMPEGHLPVASYLAAPVLARNGSVAGGLFFGHSQPGIFAEETEAIVSGIAAQAAIAMDNAALFMASERAQGDLRRSNEELRRVNEDLNQFAHSASHDLQEPLRMVSIYTELIGRKLQGQADSECDEYIRYTIDGASRMEALVRDLLAYTEASNLPQDQAPLTGADESLAQALANLKTAIDASGAQITNVPLPTLRIVPIHLTQLFQNLIGNAIKYRGEEPPRVRIGAERRDNGEWLFSVADNGIGIDPQYKEQIFGIFTRLHTNDRYSGTGIGLAICHRIVDRAGGRIWVESQLGSGSTFFFTLPGSN